jgi:quinol monooxygenase YgiN
MTAMFGMHVRFNAQPGHGGELASLLLEAADGLRAIDECLIYVVSRSPDDADTVWVTEAWTSQDAHGASLHDEKTRALIERAMPLMAGRPEATQLRPAGGKGL